MTILENASYLKGLFEGYEIDSTKKEGKIILGMLDLIAKLGEEVEALTAECGELREYIEEIDEDLGAVEEDIYFTDDDDDNYDEDFEEDFDNDFDSDSGYDEFVCPACGETICVDETLNINDVVCPACGEKIGDVELCDGVCEGCDGKLCGDDEEN